MRAPESACVRPGSDDFVFVEQRIGFELRGEVFDHIRPGGGFHRGQVKQGIAFVDQRQNRPPDQQAGVGREKLFFTVAERRGTCAAARPPARAATGWMCTDARRDGVW